MGGFDDIVLEKKHILTLKNSYGAKDYLKKYCGFTQKKCRVKIVVLNNSL